MPSLVRKLLIFAAVDGLVLQPYTNQSKHQRRDSAPPAVKIDYGQHTIAPILNDGNAEPDRRLPKLESYGIIGLLTVASSAYLISITRRNQVANLWGKPVYQISDVALIPLSSQRDAQRAITEAVEASLQLHEAIYDVDVNGVKRLDEEALTVDDDDDVSDQSSSDEHGEITSSTALEKRKGSIEGKETGIAEEVIGRRGSYGRFAERWFSQRGWMTGQRRQMGMSSHDNLAAMSSPSEISTSDQGPYEQTAGAQDFKQSIPDHQRWPQTTPKVEKSLEEAMGDSSYPDEKLTTSLLPKLVQTTKLLFGSGTFYYSYDFDITRSLEQQSRSSMDMPLFKRVNSEYFWNEYIQQPFIQSGCDEVILPVMQGFVGQRAFTVGPNKTLSPDTQQQVPNTPQKILEASDVPEELSEAQDSKTETSFMLTLISRRSTKRAGLRYLRRGIDDDGNTANSVETEQILSSPDWGSNNNVQSFVQLRGSIPLFYSQTPYTFKPVPVLHGSKEVNQVAFKKHFSAVSGRYGNVHAVSLIDAHGVEVKVGEAYQEHMKMLNDSGGVNGKPVGFEWFDFHNVCKGMRFENVSILVSTTLPFLTTSSWTVVGPKRDHSPNASSKKAIIGTVTQTQSGVIRTNCMDCLDRTNVVQSAFGQRVLELQLAAAAQTIDLTADPTTHWFNSLWADNGDAVSRAYAGTSALKGDYTRTRKRNALGALNDLTLTLSRYYRNLFDDFFAQAAIDYLLGAVTASVFTEFEAEMTSADPAVDLRPARQAAITAASHLVLPAHEDLLAGWAVAAPPRAAAPRAGPFQDVLLLLTPAALYRVRFDWAAEAVRGFERAPLAAVEALQRGAYITQTHAPVQTNPARNVGLLVRYAAPGDGGVTSNLVRTNARSLENTMLRDAWAIPEVDLPAEDAARVWAFKALPRRSSVARVDKGEAAPMGEREVVEQICSEIAKAVNAAKGEEVEVVERDIVSLEEAKRGTGYLEQIGYSLKKFVWG